VLFVGAVGLLKGCHYLAEASRLLGDRNVRCDVRMIGNAPADIICDPLFAGPHYVGSVPRAQIRREFLAADVFVFPSLCEGFALVHLEAMASGVPVVTTPNCGSIVRDGVDGIIVPVRDAAALADATEHIITDRALRARMSENARQRAQEFTWQRYGERLIKALSRFQREGTSVS
jgi:glycosyltransferase involved in cell wall biosynthesis